MGEVIQPDSMSEWMRDIERRVRNVETSPKLLTVQYTRVRAQETYISVNSTDWTTTWEIALGRVVNDAIDAGITSVCAAGTEGEMRLRVFNRWDNAVTSSQALVLQTARRFTWLIPGMADDQGALGVIIQIQARRTSGTGLINVYDPDWALQCSGFSINATSTGI